ncbi:MAG: hypothetical protein KF859_14045 [Phycisphaeraceae bacterium]|nr:hypothetical protein [Phycisphaeraceae bacterium]
MKNQRIAACVAGVCGVGVLAAGAAAQTLVGVELVTTGTPRVFAIDPVTGELEQIMAAPVGSGRSMVSLGALPDCRLVGVSGDYTGNDRTPLHVLNPMTGLMTNVAFGAPLATSFVEGLDWSPRHNALLVGFGAGSFITNRLALVSPEDGTVSSFTPALAGILDIDSVVCWANDEVLFDLNASANPRMKRVVDPMPSPTFEAFASPPIFSTDFYHDGAFHPVTGVLTLTNAEANRLLTLSGNTYVNGPAFPGGVRIQGLAWATLPPRRLEVMSATVCEGERAEIGVTLLGDGPFTFEWQRLDEGGEWISVEDGYAEGLGSIDGVGTHTLVIEEAEHAATGTRWRVLVSNLCGGVMSGEAELIVCACLECPADFNLDGGIDGADVEAFFAAWEAGSCDADVNADGGIDGGDVEVFFASWEQGGC